MADENKGEQQAAAPTKSAGKTVKVDISRTAIHSRGTSYGPGKDVEVPVAVAERHGLKGAKAERKQAKTKAKATRRASARKR
jgi:hypothetical protein